MHLGFKFKGYYVSRVRDGHLRKSTEKKNKYEGHPISYANISVTPE